MPNPIRSVAPLGLLALAGTVALAAEALDGRRILERVADTYRHLASFQLEARVSTRMIRQGAPESFELPFVAAAARPGRSRTEMNNPSMGMIVVSDGKTTWTYSQPLNQYTRKAAAAASPTGADSNGVMAGPGSPIARYFQLARGVRSARWLRTQTLRNSGRAVECEVVEADYEHPVGLQATYSPTVYWIDRTRWIVLRESTFVRVEGADAAGHGEVAQTTTYDVARINQTPPDSLFAFRPPPGATEVRSFGGDQAVDLSGQKAEDFTLNDLAGKPVRLSSLRGKVVMLDFWATWCGPCRIEMPNVQKLHDQFRKKGLVVLGVNYGERPEAVRPFLKQTGYSFRILMDREQKVGMRYQVSGIPTLFIIDKGGTIRSHFIGVRDLDVLRDALADAGMR